MPRQGILGVVAAVCMAAVCVVAAAGVGMASDPPPYPPCPPSQIFIGHCATFVYPFSWPDHPEPITFEVVSGVGAFDEESPSVWQYSPTIADVGMPYTVVVGMTDAVGDTASCTFEVWVTNDAPVVVAPRPAVLMHMGVAQEFQFVADDVDCDSGRFLWVELMPPFAMGSYGMDPETGVVTISPGCYSVGQYTCEVYYTDGITTVSSTMWVEVMGCCYRRGNCSGGPSLDVADLTEMAAILFRGSSNPDCALCFLMMDLNDDEQVNVADLVYFVSYLFKGGPAPVPCPCAQ